MWLVCFVCLRRISATGQVDKRDSIGVCVGCEGEAESLQRDQAVCISTNGTITFSTTKNCKAYNCRVATALKVSKTWQIFFSPSLYPSSSYSFLSPSPLFSPGAVFVNGKEMTNQLPSITLGSAVTFDMEVVNLLPISNNNNLSDGGNFKLRVTIGSGNREVVFDWLLDQGVDCLFFGCSLAHPGWKVLVFWACWLDSSPVSQHKGTSRVTVLSAGVVLSQINPLDQWYSNFFLAGTLFFVCSFSHEPTPKIMTTLN